MRSFLVCAAFAVIGCARPHMTAAQLAARAQRNVLAAERDLAAKWIVVHGRVVFTTVTARESIEAHGTSYFATASVVHENVPVVILDPGSVLCYFEPADIDEAASVNKGDEVAFLCRVSSFRPDRTEVLSVLAACRRAN